MGKDDDSSIVDESAAHGVIRLDDTTSLQLPMRLDDTTSLQLPVLPDDTEDALRLIIPSQELLSSFQSLDADKVERAIRSFVYTVESLEGLLKIHTAARVHDLPHAHPSTSCS